MEVVVGRVAKSHGVRGELAVEVRTDSPEERFAVGTVLHGRRSARGRGRVTDYTVEAVRQHAGRLLLRLEGVDDRAAADALRGWVFVVDTADLPVPDDPDEFHDHQLVGLVARLADGTRVGTVSDVVHTAGQELLVLRVPAASGTRGPATEGPAAAGEGAEAAEAAEVLVPFVSRIVTAVSLEDGTVTLDPPAGLLDPHSAVSAEDEEVPPGQERPVAPAGDGAGA